MKRLLLVTLFLTVSCFAQTTPAKPRTIIHAAKLFDAKAGRVLTNQDIVIEGDKIVSVGPAKAAPADRVINAPFVLPGLIDVHTHITGDPKFGYEELSVSVPREALTGAKNAKITLDAGFTTIRNLGASGYTEVALRDAIN